jgi:16S rRNA (guanine527-N7)-methyltransferase
MTGQQQAQLNQFANLIERYHQTLDLVSGKALEQLPEKIQDALAYPEAIKGLPTPPSTILDVGSGAGLPGIPTAIALPYCRIVLVERRQKRSAFLKIVQTQLGLENLSVLEGDVQAINLAPLTVITAQAVGTFLQLYCLTRHLHDRQICLFSRKGEAWEQEIKALETALQVSATLVSTTELSRHGRLIGVYLGGGRPCPASGSSTKKVG